MEIRCFVSFNSNHGIEPIIRGVGIKYKKMPPDDETNFMATFDISESDPAWPVVAKLIAEKKLFHGWYTVFAREEILNAEWLMLRVTGEQGYPQPVGGMRWKGVAFASGTGCPKCGVGVVQEHSFRMKNEPSVGKRGLANYGLMRLVWTPAFFAIPDVFEALAAAGLRGYEKWPVIIHSTGAVAENVAQIYVTQETEAGLLDKDALSKEVCKVCGQVKFNRVMKGRIKYRRNALPPDVDFVRTHEWFGSGGYALQEVFVTGRVAKLLIERGWKGAELAPAELV